MAKKPPIDSFEGIGEDEIKVLLAFYALRGTAYEAPRFPKLREWLQWEKNPSRLDRALKCLVNRGLVRTDEGHCYLVDRATVSAWFAANRPQDLPPSQR